MSMYSVALEGAATLPLTQRIQAEVQFARSLEAALGGEGDVVAGLTAWKQTTERLASELDQEVIRRAMQWPVVVRRAERAALRGVSRIEGAHFVVGLRTART